MAMNYNNLLEFPSDNHIPITYFKPRKYIFGKWCISLDDLKNPNGTMITKWHFRNRRETAILTYAALAVKEAYLKGLEHGKKLSISSEDPKMVDL